MLLNYFRLARLDYWFKNIFVIVGLFFFIILSNKENIIIFHNFYLIILSLASICLICSSNYVMNEIVDLKTDKFHSIKKSRPLVSKKISIGAAKIFYVCLLFFGLFFGLFINKVFFLLLIILIFSGFIYNLEPIKVKNITYLDVVFESFNIVIRFMLGWYILNTNYVPPLSILLIFWFTGGFLMTMKRYAEYDFLSKKNLINYRISFKNYTKNNLLLMGIIYLLLVIFFLGIFIVKYKHELILSVPLVILIFIYYLNISFKKNSKVQFAETIMSDLNLLAIISIFFILFLYLLNTNINFLEIFFDVELIKF